MYDATEHHADTFDGDRGPPVFYADEGPDHVTEDRAAAEIERITTEHRDAVVVHRMDLSAGEVDAAGIGCTFATMTDEERFAALRADRRGPT